MFNETFLYETPTTDPKTLVGRNVEVGVPQLTGDKKHQMKLVFKIEDVKDKKALTRFNGYSCSRDFIARGIRKGSSKIESTDYFSTKDNWKLQITTTSILNRSTESTIQAKIRKFVKSFMETETGQATIDDFVKGVISGLYQKKLRKDGSKTYPIRFAEINKIEVIQPGMAK